MCYSAQIRNDFARFTREYGAVIDIAEFVLIVAALVNRR